MGLPLVIGGGLLLASALQKDGPGRAHFVPVALEDEIATRADDGARHHERPEDDA